MSSNDPELQFGDVAYASPDPRRRGTRRSTLMESLVSEAEEQYEALEVEDDPEERPREVPEGPPIPDQGAFYDEDGTVQQETERPTRGWTPNLFSRGEANRESDHGTADTNAGCSIVINGQAMVVRDERIRPSDFKSHKTYSKHDRKEYDSEERATFIKSAQRYVLSKGNKLKVFSMELDDEKKLEHVRNLGLQLKLLKDHLVDHDMEDVFTIVIPKNVTSSVEILKETYDLFTSFPKLHPKLVANSCAWYNSWAAEDYVGENMKLSFEFFRNNTDEYLFNKTLETYEQYPVMSRGGPLMAYLLLSKILTTTESAIEILIKKIQKIKIRDIKGEDVDSVVSLVRSTVDVLRSASDEGRSYVPDDFPKTVLQVFQTSSNEAFNETFAEEQKAVQRESDKSGRKPQWPLVETTLLQAERVYQRLVVEGAWCVSPSQKRHALNVTSFKGGKPPRNLDKRTCWNCGRQGCSVEVCDKPKDQDRIDKNRKKFMAHKQMRQNSRNSSSNSSSISKTREYDDKGRPLKQNKNGVFVVDTKAYRDQEKTKLLEKVSDSKLDSKSKDKPKKDKTSNSEHPAVNTAGKRVTFADSDDEQVTCSALQAQISRAQNQVSRLYE